MKKTFLALAVVALFGIAFTACGGDDEPKTKTETFLKPAPYANSSVRVDASDEESITGFIDQTTGTGTGIVSTETTESGKLILGVLPGTQFDKNTSAMPGVQKKSLSSLLNLLFFDVTLNGNTYQIGTYGTLTVIREGSKYKFILNLFGIEVTFYATPSEKLPASDRTTSLARDWKVKSCQLQVKLGAATLAHNFDGCNLNEIEQWMIKNGASISPDDRVPEGSNIICLGFTASKTYYIKYENKKIDGADWRWVDEKNGDLKYSWRDSDMGNAYEAGACTAKFYDGNCELTIEAVIKGSDGDSYPCKLVATLTDK